MKNIILVYILNLIGLFFICCNTIKIGNENINQKDKGVLQTGIWIITNDTTKQIVLSKYKLGKLDGKYFVYHSNGQIAISGNYKHGKRQGRFYYYLSNGGLTGIATFKNDSLVSQKIYNPRW